MKKILKNKNVTMYKNYSEPCNKEQTQHKYFGTPDHVELTNEKVTDTQNLTVLLFNIPYERILKRTKYEATFLQWRINP